MMSLLCNLTNTPKNSCNFLWYIRSKINNCIRVKLQCNHMNFLLCDFVSVSTWVIFWIICWWCLCTVFHWYLWYGSNSIILSHYLFISPNCYFYFIFKLIFYKNQSSDKNIDLIFQIFHIFFSTNFFKKSTSLCWYKNLLFKIFELLILL